MVEVKGKLSSLFKRTACYTEVTDEILESMIDCPITKDGTCIGIIKKVNVKHDEWSGYLFDAVAAEVSRDMKYCQSINFISVLDL
jgi:hypothetical protein